MAESPRAGVAVALRRDLGLGARFARARARSELQYRTSFALLSLAQVAALLTDLVAILALFSKVPAIGGWRREQVLVLYAVTTTAFALANAVASPVDYLAEWVRTGRFDRLLLRPAGPLAQLAGMEFQLRRLAALPPAVVTLVVAGSLGHVPLTVRSLALLTLAVLGSATLFGALFVATASLAFWSPDSDEVANAFTYGGQLAAQYPAHVYADWLRRWMFSLVPVGLAAYAPVMAAVGAPNPLGLPAWLEATGPLVALPFLFLAALAWRTGTRRYASTGS